MFQHDFRAPAWQLGGMAYLLFALILTAATAGAYRIRRTNRAKRRLEAEMRHFGIE